MSPTPRQLARRLGRTEEEVVRALDQQRDREERERKLRRGLMAGEPLRVSILDECVAKKMRAVLEGLGEIR